MEEAVKRIYDYSLEYIMGDSFSRYAKAIIQDRALPDVRDGLKPVQRRILYGMYKDGNTYDKPTKKSAKAVGNIMGYYHPHGDSSIYDALVRMSQWWKNNLCYVEMQGNNGSMDGDGAAAGQGLGHGGLHTLPAEQRAFDAHRILGDALEHHGVTQILLGGFIG